MSLLRSQVYVFEVTVLRVIALCFVGALHVDVFDVGAVLNDFSP
jgi:hypothetical protein